MAALLYSLLPYHFYRGQDHLCLASYFLIPPMVVVVLRIYLDRDAPREGERGPVRWWNRRAPTGPWAVPVCLFMGCGGIYYAFFSCYLLLVAGVAAGLRRRRLGPLVGAGLLIGVVIAAVLANLAPKLLYDLRHGPNPTAVSRSPLESEFYGLRIAQLLAPIEGHRLPWLARLRATLGENLPTLLHKDEAYHPAPGAVASVGFLLLLGRFLARRSSAWPKALDGLALLNLAALLLAVTGGLGTVFNLLVSPMIRCYNRMSIFIACFALFALALLWEELRTRLPAFRHRLAGQVALGLVLVGGILDQTSPAFVPPYARLREAFASDADFVGGIEAALPGTPWFTSFRPPSSRRPTMISSALICTRSGCAGASGP